MCRKVAYILQKYQHSKQKYLHVIFIISQNMFEKKLNVPVLLNKLGCLTLLVGAFLLLPFLLCVYEKLPYHIKSEFAVNAPLQDLIQEHGIVCLHCMLT